MLTFILEAAFRSLLMALAVWTSIRLLRVQAVLAQKVAWVLVLLAAGTMPLVMRAPFLALDKAMRIPIRPFASAGRQAVKPNPLEPVGSAVAGDSVKIERLSQTPKPSAAHVATQSMDSSTSLSNEPDDDLTSFAQSSALASDSATPVNLDSSSLPTSVTLVQPRSRPAELTEPSGIRASLKSRIELLNWSQIKSSVIMAYFSIGALLLLRMLLGLGVAFRIWRRAEPVVDLPADMFSVASPHSMVRVSRDLATPVTIGSTVILPADYRAWDTAKLRVVLAHEGSHVRQGDFYLQLLAALHVAVFWFSPLGWWLQRKLSELGEALSDRAGLEQAPNAASYARILLEFAAIPRTKSYVSPLAGVAMARSSNLSSRIERILNARRFRLEFLSGRGHAFLTALLVPAALIAVVACIRVVPAVEAAQGQSLAPVTGQTSTPVAGQSTGQASESVADQVTTVNVAPAPAPAAAPAFAPDAQAARTPEPVQEAEPAPVPEPEQVQAPEPPTPPRHSHGSTYRYSTRDDGEDSFAIVRGKDSDTTITSGDAGEELEKARQKYHDNFIWFEHDGKSYVITDPAILAQSQALFKGDPRLEQRQKALEAMQANLDQEMAKLQPEIAKASLPGPEFTEQMAKLNAQLAELQSDKFKKLTEQINKEIQENQKVTEETVRQITQEKLGELQEKIGDIQGQIGEIQGKIGEREGLMGEKQGEIGERMGKVGEEMGKIGEQQGKMAEEASRKMKSVLDQAIKDGKAKPID
jgi:BlaR1 peptidase M56